MYALTIQQPWIWAIEHAGKRIENRTCYPPRFILEGDAFALHAGKTFNEDGFTGLREENIMVPDSEPLPLGCVCGIAKVKPPILKALYDDGHNVIQVIECGSQNRIQLGSQAKWFVGPYGWPLTELEWLMDPIPCRGNQGFWRLPDDVHRNLASQLMGF